MSTCTACGGLYYAPPSARSKRVSCSRECRARLQTEWQSKDVHERFWSKVQKSDGCWLWTGSLVFGGYGSINIDGTNLRAHRVMYEWTKGPIPDGLLIRHTCDNPQCVNPDHLLLGDKRSNTQDAMERGQHVLGEKHYNCKLTKADVDTIRRELAAGVQGRVLAKRFGVNESWISQIKNGKKRRYG